MSRDNEPRWLTIGHDDVCRECGAEISPKDRVLHLPAVHVYKNLCADCGKNDSRNPEGRV